ncbi:CueP family metal-binding protein [Microbacterium aurantiacum]|nr:CueP family metal-binding protein [Microbacterium aurantiacum]
MAVLAAAGAAVLAMLLAGCAPSSDMPQATTSTLLTEQGLTGMTTTQIIDHLDQMSVNDRPTDLFASVRPEALILADDEQEVSLAMPADVSYVSIAPFLQQTHDCFFHSLTTCRGELSSQPIEVRILDHATGDVLIDEATTTFDNGFVGYWLPRGVEGAIEVTHDGRTGTTAFSTMDDAPTCITTLQLV